MHDSRYSRICFQWNACFCGYWIAPNKKGWESGIWIEFAVSNIISTNDNRIVRFACSPSRLLNGTIQYTSKEIGSIRSNQPTKLSNYVSVSFSWNQFFVSSRSMIDMNPRAVVRFYDDQARVIGVEISHTITCLPNSRPKAVVWRESRSILHGLGCFALSMMDKSSCGITV